MTINFIKFMSLTQEELSEALANSNSTDEEIRSQSEQCILSVKNDSDGILLFLQIILTTDQSLVRKAAIVNLLTITSKRWIEISKETQDQALQLIIQIVKMKLSHEELSMMADCCSDIFKVMGFWNELVNIICFAYTEKNHHFTMLFISKIFPVMSSQATEHVAKAFQTMALSGIQSSDRETRLNAAKIFIQIGSKINDASVVEPAFEFLIQELLNSKNLQNIVEFSAIWLYVRNILSIKSIDESAITAFFEVAKQLISDDSIDSERRQLIISEFEPAIAAIPTEMLADLISGSLSFTYDYIVTEEELPDKPTDLLDKSLLVRSYEITEFVKKQFEEYFNNSQNESSEKKEPNLIIALYILRSLLKNSTDSMINEIDVVKLILQQSLSSENILVQSAALQIIDILDIQFTESAISSISVPLMQQVAKLLFSPTAYIRSQSSNAFLTLCDMCDTEVDDLFNSIWSLQKNGNVPNECLSDYLLILGKAISLSKNIPDSDQEEVLKFIEEIIFSEENENDDLLTEKATSLNALSPLFSKNITLMPTVLPKIEPVVSKILLCDDDNAVCQALSFLTNLSKTFHEELSEFLTNYNELLVKIIKQRQDESRSYLSSMNTAASMIKYCNDLALVQPMIDEINYIFLFNSNDTTTLTEACNYITMMSKKLVDYDKETVQKMFKFLIQIVKDKDYDELLYNSFAALTKLYKRCHQTDTGFYDQSAEDLINSTFNGQIKLLNGSTENLFHLQYEMASYILDFADVYLRVNPNAKEIFDFLIEWLKNANEDVASCILGTISESLKANDIDTEILSPIIEYLTLTVETASAVRLLNNIAYFLSIFLLKYKDQFSEVANFLPFLNKWWDEGKEKKYGYQTCLSNIAVLYLRLFVCGAKVPFETINKAISAFPPADITETENMSLLILDIFQTHQDNGEFIQSIIKTTAFAIADLLTQPPTSPNMIKISQQSLENIQQLFKAILSDNEDIKNQLFQFYQNNAEQQKIISQYF